MARNGSGTYSLPTGNPVVTGTTISSTTHNNTMTDIGNELTNSLAKDGQTTPTANLPMGGFKHTGVASATARTDYCTAGQSQDNTFDWLTSVAGTDTITATAPISMSAYAAGQTFRFASAGANTGAATLNINAIGAKSITKLGTTALAAGDIPSGAVVEVVYDGTQFQMVDLVSKHAATADSATSATSATTATNIAGGASGSLPYQTGAGATSLLAKGTNGDVLTLAAGIPAWATMAASLTADGYQKLPSGLIIQWGTFSTSAAGYTNWTFPTAFTTGAYVVLGTPVSASTTLGGVLNNTAANTTTTASIALVLYNNTYAAGSVMLFAIGK